MEVHYLEMLKDQSDLDNKSLEFSITLQDLVREPSILKLKPVVVLLHTRKLL